MTSKIAENFYCEDSMAKKKQKKQTSSQPDKNKMEQAEKEGTIAVFLGAAVYLTVELIAVFHFDVLKNVMGNILAAFLSLIVTLLPSLFIMDLIYKKKKLKMGYNYGVHTILLAFILRGLIQLGIFFLSRPPAQ